MKIIFLDIDGVLNTSKTFIDIYNEYLITGKRLLEIDIDRVLLLKEIILKTEALIVLSSSWRNFLKKENDYLIPLNKKMSDLLELFFKNGLSIYDITGKDREGNRGREIQNWLDSHSVSSFIILDDDSYDLSDFCDKELIKTSFTAKNKMIENMNDTCGLCLYHVEKAVSILNKNDKRKEKKL